MKNGGSCCSKSGRTPEVVIIGNGSNILVRDGGFDGVIIKLGDEFTKIEQDGEQITAGAAALLSTVSKERKWGLRVWSLRAVFREVLAVRCI